MSDILKGVKDIKTFKVSDSGEFPENEKVDNVLDEKMDFKFDGNDFKSLRQAFTYSKAKFFGDKDNAKLLLETTKPENIQEIDDSIKNFNAKKWDQAKSRIAYSILSEGSQNSHRLEKSVENGLDTRESFIDKMGEKLRNDMKSGNVTQMSLNKITKRFNKNVSLEI